MPISKIPSVFVIGDSISIHYGPFLEKLLEKKFTYNRKGDGRDGNAGNNLDNPEGANGGDSGMVLEYLRFRRKHDPINADILLLNCGLHDIKTNIQTGVRQVSLQQYIENLTAILLEARAMNLNVIWIKTTPVIDEIHNTLSTSFWRFASDVKSYNDAADQVMKEAVVPIIDLHSFTERFLPGGFVDHAHFNEKLRRAQGEFLAQALEKWQQRSS